jgi:sec-independent protein translocase protein TatB
MFELDWGKLLLIGIVALIVIGPKELPAVLRTLGQWTAKLRRMATEFQNQFHEAMREAELTDLKKQVDEMTSQAKSYANFDPVADVRREFESTQRQIETSMAETPKSEPSISEPSISEPSNSEFAKSESNSQSSAELVSSSPPTLPPTETAPAQTLPETERAMVPTPDAGIPVTASTAAAVPAAEDSARSHDAGEKPA